jgi:hypothetical protein
MLGLYGMPPALSGLYDSNVASRAARAKTLEEKYYAPRRALYEKYGKDLAARRAGPTPSESLYSIGAALMKPTQSPGFGGMIANVAPVMAERQKAIREAEDAKNEMLTKYKMDVGTLEGEQLKGEQTGLNTADAQRFAAMLAYYKSQNEPKFVPGVGWVMPPSAVPNLPARPPGVPANWTLEQSADGSKAYVSPDRAQHVEVK